MHFWIVIPWSGLGGSRKNIPLLILAGYDFVSRGIRGSINHRQFGYEYHGLFMIEMISSINMISYSQVVLHSQVTTFKYTKYVRYRDMVLC